MTGRFGLAMRMARSVSMPLMPGSMMSRITRSTASSASSTESASSPLAAMATSKPSRRSTASRTSRRTSSSSTIRIRIDLCPSVLRRGGGARQRYCELSAVAGSALHRDFAIRSVQDATGDRQTQARPSLTALGRDQRLEDPAEQFGRDPFAVVFDPDVDALTVLLHVNPDVATLPHSISSVEENVGQNLLQVMKVPTHPHFRNVGDVDRDRLRFEEVFMQRERGGDQDRHADDLAG